MAQNLPHAESDEIEARGAGGAGSRSVCGAGRLGPPRWLQVAVMGARWRPGDHGDAARRACRRAPAGGGHDAAVVLGVHPLEAAMVRRYGKRRGVAARTRRRATFATLAYGAFAAVPATRKIRKSHPLNATSPAAPPSAHGQARSGMAAPSAVEEDGEPSSRRVEAELEQGGQVDLDARLLSSSARCGKRRTG
jgi:hypothetical protein